MSSKVRGGEILRRIYQHPWSGIIAVLGVCVLMPIVVEIVKPRTIAAGDFEVYGLAARQAVAGTDVYTMLFHGQWIPEQGIPFTYTPIAAILLWPTTIFPFTVSLVLWNIISLVSLAVSLHCAWSTVRARTDCDSDYLQWLWDAKHWPWILAATIVILNQTVIIDYHLARGQINLLLMALCLGDIARREDSTLGRFLPRGSLIGFAAAVKLTPFFFLIQFIVIKQWRVAMFTVLGAAVATAVGLLLLPTMSIHYFTDRIWHLSSSVAYSPHMFESSGNGSIQGVCAFLGFPPWCGTLLAGVACVAGLWCVRQAYLKRDIFASTVSAGVIATLITPVSWIHHAVFIFPALLVLVMDSKSNQRKIAYLLILTLFLSGQSKADQLFTMHHWWVWPVALPLRLAQIASEICAVVLLTFPTRTTREKTAQIPSMRRTQKITVAPPS